MDTAAAQWPQDIVVKPMEEMVTCPKPGHPPQDRKIRPQKEHALNCPRCSSTNTKFCYYNNYSLSQPRYFCKTCRRYWTEGGSLRNIPVGGGSRKNKRSSSSHNSNNNNSTTTPSSSSSLLPPKRLPDLVLPQHQNQNPNSKLLESVATPQDLNLGFSAPSHVRHDFKAITDMIHVPDFDATTKLELQNPNSSSSSSNLDLLTGAARGGLNANFMPLMATTTDLNTVYSSSGFSFNHPDQFKPSLSFSLDGLGSSYGSFQGVPETNGKLLFPFEDLKQVSSSNNTNEHGEDHRDTNHHGDSTGYWNGVIGNGGPW